MPVSDAAQRDVYTLALRRMLRIVGWIAPPVIVGFGLVVRQGWVDNSYYHSDALFAAICILVILLSTWHYFKDVKTPNDDNARKAILIGYHLLAIMFFVFVSGFNGPILLAWLILLFGTDIYFGAKGFWLSMLAMFATWYGNGIYHGQFGTSENIESLLSIIIIAVTALMITKIRVINDYERKAFYRSKRREEIQQDRLLTLINSIGDACISTNKKGEIQIYNAAALNLLDTNQTLKGRRIDEVLHIIDKVKRPVDIMKLLADSDAVMVRSDLSHQFSDGEEINLYMNLATIRTASQQKSDAGHIFVMRDITKEKSLEEERDEFISVVSHELRTPVAVTEGNLSNIKYILEKGGDPKTLNPAIDAAHEQVIFLAKMINDLSTLSRAERGVADVLEDIDVRELMTTLYNEYVPQAKEKGLKLDIDLTPVLGVVSASRLYLEETLQNFITNAIKYTKEGTVTIGASRVDNKEIEFRVSDTGIGMNKMDQRHIFEKFYRSEDYRTRETGGTGLGLYVVQKLTHKLKIKVEVESRLNHGSTFSFKMPVKD